VLEGDNWLLLLFVLSNFCTEVWRISKQRRTGRSKIAYHPTINTIKLSLLVFRFPQRCNWRLRSSRLWCCVAGFKAHEAVIPEHEDNTVLRNVGNNFPQRQRHISDDGIFASAVYGACLRCCCLNFTTRSSASKTGYPCGICGGQSGTAQVSFARTLLSLSTLYQWH